MNSADSNFLWEFIQGFISAIMTLSLAVAGAFVSVYNRLSSVVADFDEKIIAVAAKAEADDTKLWAGHNKHVAETSAFREKTAEALGKLATKADLDAAQALTNHRLDRILERLTPR